MRIKKNLMPRRTFYVKRQITTEQVLYTSSTDRLIAYDFKSFSSVYNMTSFLKALACSQRRG